MSVLGIHVAARRDRVIGDAVSRFHEVALKFVVENLDLSQPLAGRGSDPSRNECACRKSVMPGQRSSVHSGCNQCVRVGRLFDWNAANERRHFSGNFVETAKHYVLAGWLYARSE